MATTPPVVQHTPGRNRQIEASASRKASGATASVRSSARRESGSRSDSIGVAWNARPAAGTSSASRPRRPPRKRNPTSGSISRSASAIASSGLTCPPVPPPTRSTRHARWRRRGLSSNVEEDTDRDETDAERRAAVRDEGKRDARHRHEAGDDGHVHPGLEHEPGRDARRDERAHRIGRTQRDTDAAVPEHEEQDDHGERAGETELVAEDREDRIRVREGQVAELFSAGPESLTEQTAERETIQGLDRLVSLVAGIAPRIEEGRDPLQSIGARERTGERDDNGKRSERGEHPQPRSGREIHDERDHSDDDRRPEVGLDEDERGEDGGDDEHAQHDPGRGDPIATRAKPRREVEEEGKLRELGGLQPDRTRPKPARGAVHARADTGQEHRAKQRDRDDQQGKRERAVAVVVDTRRGEHRDQYETR